MKQDLIKILSNIADDPESTYEELEKYIRVKILDAEINILQKQIDKLKATDSEKVDIQTKL